MKAQGQNGYEEGVIRLHEIENKGYPQPMLTEEAESKAARRQLNGSLRKKVGLPE